MSDTPTPISAPADLDRVSLVQALKDFEIANARVLDLTQRLIAAERRCQELEAAVHRYERATNGPLRSLVLEESPRAAAYRAWRRVRKVALSRFGDKEQP